MPFFPRMLLAAGLVAGATLTAHADDALDAAKADMAATLGPNSVQTRRLPRRIRSPRHGRRPAPG